MNIVKELKEHGVALESIIFTQFPFGTSNDLSRAFGWGATPSRNMKFDLDYLWNMLWDAEEVPFDIWNVCVTTEDENGDIFIVSNRDLVSIGAKSLNKLMCHSFSFGVDARVGINFERRRTQSRCWNQVRYTLEGIKRILCWCKNRTLKCREVLSTFTRRHIDDQEEIKEDEEDEENQIYTKGKIKDTSNNKSSLNENKSNDTVEDLENQTMDQMAGDITIASDRDIEADYYIRGNPVSLYWANIAVIMGGRCNIWRTRDCGKLLHSTQRWLSYV